MKYQSTYDPNIFVEKAEDMPICCLDGLDLVSIFHRSRPHFFFSGWKKNKNRKSHVGYYLKYYSLSPYRIMEEDAAHATVWKYLRDNKQYRRSSKGLCTTYRLWGTPYIKEMNTRGTYSDYKEDAKNKVFQLMIITDDETIEIIAPQKMKWVKYDPKKIKSILNDLIKKW